MQVSWIDADQIKALVAQIGPLEASTVEAPVVMEIDTPAATSADSWGFAMDWSAPPTQPVPSAALMETVLAEPMPPEPQPEREMESDDDRPAHALHNPAAALPLSRIRDKLRAIRQRAAEAGILTRTSDIAPPEPAPEVTAPVDAESSIKEDEPPRDAVPEHAAAPPAAPAFDLPHGSRDVRLAAFAGWAKQVLHEDGGHVLVMSDDGEVLWGGESKAGLVLSTMMAWGAAIRASAMSACETPPLIHQPLASGNVLTVIPCETACGIVHAAVAAPAGLSHDQAHVLRGALCAAMN